MLGSARSVLLKPAAGSPPVTLPAAYAAYNLNEGSGTTAADSSGNSRTLTLASATWAAGHTGAGLTNSAANTGASATFSSPTAAITLMAWIRPLALDTGVTYFATGFLNVGNSTIVALFNQRSDFGPSDVLQANIRIEGTGLVSIGGPALTLNTWTHVALTYDGATLSLYKDGIAVNSLAQSGTITAGDVLFVGGNPLYNSNLDIDDARVFNTALTGAEVAAAMTTPV